MPETRAPCSLRAAPLLGLGIKTLPGVSIACELIGLGLEPWGENTEAESSSLLQDQLGPSRRVRRPSWVSPAPVRSAFLVPLSLSTQYRAILAAPHGTLSAFNAELLAIYWPGQSAPGGGKGDRPPSLLFFWVGGGGFGARDEASKGPHTRQRFSRARIIYD